jgi:hypothetical protein
MDRRAIDLATPAGASARGPRPISAARVRVAGTPLDLGMAGPRAGWVDCHRSRHDYSVGDHGTRPNEYRNLVLGVLSIVGRAVEIRLAVELLAKPLDDSTKHFELRGLTIWTNFSFEM